MSSKRKRRGEDVTIGGSRGLTIVDVDDTNRFEMQMRRTTLSEAAVLIGILPAAQRNASLDNVRSLTLSLDARRDIFQIVHGFFIYHDKQKRRAEAQDGTQEIFELHSNNQSEFEYFAYEAAPTPTLYFGKDADHRQPVKFRTRIPAGDYVACVLHYGSATVQLRHINSSPRKRAAAPSFNRMWEERLFTDAVVACEGRLIPVHRAVLVMGSPVFAAAFQGEMVEAQSARFEVQAGCYEAVHAMLCFMYTGELNPKLAIDVLPLAHTYQLEDLVSKCCEIVPTQVKCDNICSILRALKPFQGDEVVGQCWRDVVKQLQEKSQLLDAALNALI